MSEREIFQAICRWCRQNGDGPEAKEVMSAVRLPLMTLSEMLNVVRPTRLLSPDDLLDAIQTRSESRDMDLNYRGMLSKFALKPAVLADHKFCRLQVWSFFDPSSRGEHRHYEARCCGGKG